MGGIIVVYGKNDELIACIPLDDMEHSIAKDGVNFSYYQGSEPVFSNDNGIMRVNHNACVAKVNIKK